MDSSTSALIAYTIAGSLGCIMFATVPNVSRWWRRGAAVVVLLSTAIPTLLLGSFGC